MQRSHAIGLLLIRLGLGVWFVWFGLSKLLGGPDRWGDLGEHMALFGLGFWPAMWGFCAGLGELLGGLALALGLLFRPACILLAVIMLVAVASKLAGVTGTAGEPLTAAAWLGAAIKASSHPGMLLVVLSGLCCTGPGDTALDRRYRMTLTRRYTRDAEAARSAKREGAAPPLRGTS